MSDVYYSLDVRPHQTDHVVGSLKDVSLGLFSVSALASNAQRVVRTATAAKADEPCRELGPVPQIEQSPSPSLSLTVQPGPSRSTIETFCFGTGAETANFSFFLMRSRDRACYSATRAAFTSRHKIVGPPRSSAAAPALHCASAAGPFRPPPSSP
jgi:hypothetical protein